MGKNKGEIDRKGYKRGQSHVKRGMCVWMCAFPSDLLSLPAEEEEGTWLSMFMCVLHVGAVQGSTLSVATCAMAMSVSGLCGTGIPVQLCYWLNQQRGMQQPRPSAEREAPGTGVGTSGQPGGSPGTGDAGGGGHTLNIP